MSNVSATTIIPKCVRINPSGIYRHILAQADAIDDTKAIHSSGNVSRITSGIPRPFHQFVAKLCKGDEKSGISFDFLHKRQ